MIFGRAALSPHRFVCRETSGRPENEIRRYQLPEIVEQDSESEIEKASRDESNERQPLPQLTAFETLPGDDSEKIKNEQRTVDNYESKRPLDVDHGSRKESQQDSGVPTGPESRVRRPLV